MVKINRGTAVGGWKSASRFKNWNVRNARRTFRNLTVTLGGNLFVSCIFENCALAYRSEDCEWGNCKFSNCRMTLNGAAGKTLEVLEALGMVLGLNNQTSGFRNKTALDVFPAIDRPNCNSENRVCPPILGGSHGIP